MVQPYSIPAIFGTVRPSREPIQPVERYALYPYSGQGYMSLLSQNVRKQAAASIPARNSVGSFTLPRQARAALQAAADSSAAWLAQSGKVSAALSDIRMKGKSAFDQRAVIVEGTGSAGIRGEADAGAARTDYSVHVASLSRRQQNQGYELTKNAPSVISGDTHTFMLQADGQLRSLSAAIRNGDTNTTALGKLRDSINGAKLGVTATVQGNQTNGTVKLVVDASGIGTKHAFVLRDVRGSIIASSGADRASAKASDLHVLVDGNAYHSDDPNSNGLVLQQGKVRISLEDMTAPADITIKVRNDIDALSSQLHSVLGEANTLQDTYNESGYLNPMLKQRVNDVLRSPELESIGISQTNDGKWQVDDEKLGAAMDKGPDDVSRIVNGRRGLASRLQQTLDELSELPTESLISMKASGFRPFTLYRASSSSYLQLPLDGLFVNSMM